MKGARQSEETPADHPSSSSVQPQTSTAGFTPSGINRFPDSFAEFYQRAGAANFGLSAEEFAAILVQIGAKYLPGVPLPRDENDLAVGADDSGLVSSAACAFYSGLRLEELALARACAKGVEQAWEIFLGRYREILYDAALSIAGEESAGRELADSIYAELFGIGKGDGSRASKLNSYTGRGSLEGWLRAVLAQEQVNRYRRQRRLVSLEEQVEAGAQFRAAGEGLPSEAGPALDPRLEAAADEALQDLSPEDRYILASYYLDGQTLAEIAGVLGLHESTVSRRVGRITKAIRKRLVKGLRARGMSREQAEEALEADVRDFSLDVRARLV